MITDTDIDGDKEISFGEFNKIMVKLSNMN